MASFNLERFAEAQEPVMDNVIAELRAGMKMTHWMWFVFPQLAGLGRSPRALFYGIASLAEAEAYLAHKLLGPRLLLCTEIVNGLHERTAYDIFGAVDEMKFRSSMTLFSRAAPDEPAFRNALDRYFAGEADRQTLQILAG